MSNLFCIKKYPRIEYSEKQTRQQIIVHTLFGEEKEEVKGQICVKDFSII